VLLRELTLAGYSSIIAVKLLYARRDYIAFSLEGGEVADVFFGYNFPNVNGSGWNLEHKSGATVHTHTKIGGNSPRSYA